MNENSSPGFGPTGSADGGTVPKTGKPYADRHPYLLADGEEVISNRWGQADRHRSLLKAINAGRLADGGTARRWGRSAPSGGSGTVRHVVEVKVVGGELDLVLVHVREAPASADDEPTDRRVRSDEQRGTGHAPDDAPDDVAGPGRTEDGWPGRRWSRPERRSSRSLPNCGSSTAR
mgnify:CR=1 FL=1